MRRTILLLVGASLGIFALGSDSPREYDSEVEAPGIEGTWLLIKYELNGQKGKPSTEIQEVMTFQRGTFTSTFGNRYTWRGQYRIDPARRPSHLDEIATHGDFKNQPIRCIYQIDGDTLRVANLAAPNRRRPQGFKADGVYVETYQRVK
jgi:uncharacterized protein (TIGR03067 family)